MSDNEETIKKFETIRDPDFKVIFVDGVAGELNPDCGTLTFFYDQPDLETNPQGVMSVEKLIRHLAIDIKLSPEKWVLIARWMAKHADYYEKWRNEQHKNKDNAV